MNTVKLKYVAELNPRVDFKQYKQEMTVSFLPMERVKKGYIIPKETILDNYNNSYNCFEDNDIVMAKVTPCFENGNIAIASNLDNGIGFGSSELLVLRAQKCLTKYLFYVLQDEKFRQIAISTMTGAGGLKRILPEAVKSYAINNLSIIQQQHIADYLDRKTSLIDSIIEDKERVIDLLKEKRQAIISEAVTKGLDKTAKMKDSGIEWIGKIPNGWEIVRARFVFDISTGDKDTVNNDPDGTYPFYVRSPNIERINTYTFDGEAILMAGDGVGAGRVFHYALGKFDYHQRVYNFHNFRKAYGRYVFYYMQENFKKEIERGTAKSTVDSIRMAMIQNFPIAIPKSKDEQSKIIGFLDSETAKIDKMILYAIHQIEKLKEYRQAIISEAVTGKVAI